MVTGHDGHPLVTWMSDKKIRALDDARALPAGCVARCDALILPFFADTRFRRSAEMHRVVNLLRVRSAGRDA